MPFLGKDWRSEGDEWIKTEQGWQKTKCLQFLLGPLNIQPRIESKDSDNEGDIEEEFNSYVVYESNTQPCLYLDVGCTSPNRENSSPQPSISDVIMKLDIIGSALKLKRFNYVYKLTALIIKEKFHQISGTAQGTILMMINMMLTHVLNTRINMHLMKKLLIELQKKIEYPNHEHIGSQKLWSHHLSLVNRWLKRLKKHDKKYWAKPDQNPNSQVDFTNLPCELKLSIIKRVSCGHDLIQLSQCNKEFNDLIATEETSLWRSLCFFKFQAINILAALKDQNIDASGTIKEAIDNPDIDWKALYFKLNSRHLQQDVYVDLIQKCTFCKCLFWKESGHSCTAVTEGQETTIECLNPQKFLIFLFSSWLV